MHLEVAPSLHRSRRVLSALSAPHIVNEIVSLLAANFNSDLNTHPKKMEDHYEPVDSEELAQFNCLIEDIVDMPLVHAAPANDPEQHACEKRLQELRRAGDRAEELSREAKSILKLIERMKALCELIRGKTEAEGE